MPPPRSRALGGRAGGGVLLVLLIIGRVSVLQILLWVVRVHVTQQWPEGALLNVVHLDSAPVSSRFCKSSIAASDFIHRLVASLPVARR